MPFPKTGPHAESIESLVAHDDFVRQVMAAKLSPLTPQAPALWSRWKGRTRMHLWQAAALSAGFEPIYRLQSGNFAVASLAAECGLAIESERYTEMPLLERLRCDMVFSTRLALLTDRLGGVEMDESHPVKIADVLAVALDMGWSVPNEFKVLVGGGAAPSASMPTVACSEDEAGPGPTSASAPAGGLPEPVAERNARRLDEFEELGGRVRVSGGMAVLEGERGALQTLADREKAAGRPRSDRSDISKALKSEALRRHARQSG